MFHELLRDEGLVRGQNVRKFWGGTVTRADVRQVLQIEEFADSAAMARLEAQFRDWYSWTVDLPGVYFLEVVEKLFKHNEIRDRQLPCAWTKGRSDDGQGAHVPIGSPRRRAGGCRAIVRNPASGQHTTRPHPQSDCPVPSSWPVRRQNDPSGNMANDCPLDPDTNIEPSESDAACGEAAEARAKG